MKKYLFVFRLFIHVVIALVSIIIGTIVYPFLRWYSGIGYWDMLYLMFEWLGDREDQLFKK